MVVAIAFVVALLTGLAAMPWVISRLAAEGLTGNDVNKPDRPSVPNIGGIGVAFALSAGVLLAIALSVTGWVGDLAIGPMLGAFTCVLVVMMIGLADDLLRMPPPLKGTLPMLAAIPLIASGDGSSAVDFPILGTVAFGLLYPLVLVPIGVTGAANVTNMLAGLQRPRGRDGLGGLPLDGPHRPARRQRGVGRAAVRDAGRAAGAAALQLVPGQGVPRRHGDARRSARCSPRPWSPAGSRPPASSSSCPYAADFVIKARNRFPSTGWWGTWSDGKLVHEGRPIGLAQAIMRLTGGVTERRLVAILIGSEVVAGVLAVVVTTRL